MFIAEQSMSMPASLNTWPVDSNIEKKFLKEFRLEKSEIRGF